ncbi:MULTISPECIES: MarR family winged helix-turn-helix transcriptional regulator [unclassified Bradyrhizobium]|uniref:MarR family winged helix-turn-helix transcriptional regulator n=1 Tax=unclassified Bradyrhizobium TaxID=2631580 RepID=UPI0015C97841|nr:MULTISPECIES: MarR family transcriptional regulator [unclassified Bradyrhizobium]MBB4257223.1 DNA-binding MarR family transcriptional regulator [Bradyrhizobium sp. CIR3A]MBB4359238.1 DNA-binding MarR family transcriptional regulator [Bradyrhizobium sp. CIR18]MBB4391453.1 DNA-binding MarR family transcriptional regulator [Bradyrhizobium sp. ERR14]NYG42753.1 DNA-binding MarR family transcriptional regulator [Bradyrhizobium sp. IAR9]
MSRKTDAVTRSKTRPVPEPAGDAAVRVPAAGEGKRGEQGYLGYLLRQAHAAVRLTTERTLADLGVTSPQFAVLTMLNAYPGLSGADVARLTFLTPQTVGVIIRNLERDGAILMTPHPVHGRIQQWTLTKRGTTLLKACRERVMVLEKRLADGLDAKAEASIRRWLANVATELQGD